MDQNMPFNPDKRRRSELEPRRPVIENDHGPIVHIGTFHVFHVSLLPQV